VKVDQSSYLSAVSAYDKMANSVTKLSQSPEATQSFSNVMTQSAAIGNNLIPSNSGVIKWIGDNIEVARDKIKKSEQISKKAITKEASLADMVTALSEAEIALQSVVNIRDKVISAYQDIIKMQI
jgi:flagellar hook-basal body complex protein FliE